MSIALSLGEDDSQSEDRQEEKVIQSVAEHEQELENEHLLSASNRTIHWERISRDNKHKESV